MINRLRSAGVLAVAVGVASVVPGMAHADPLTPSSDTFELSCGAESYEVVIAGNGAFLPAHDVHSTRILVPTYFGETTGTVTIAGTDEVIDQFTDPPIWKGRATKGRATSVSCTYTIVFEIHDEQLDEHLVVEITGPVEGFYTPARR